MTVQISDSVTHNGVTHCVFEYSNGAPFNPPEFGYRPVMASTACWRGHHCQYRIENSRLFLRRLTINHQDPDPSVPKDARPPDLNGVMASLSEHGFFGRWVFDDVNLPLEYTGSLIVRAEFQVNARGVLSAVAYRSELELIFRSGELVSEVIRNIEVSDGRSTA